MHMKRFFKTLQQLEVERIRKTRNLKARASSTINNKRKRKLVFQERSTLPKEFLVLLFCV